MLAPRPEVVKASSGTRLVALVAEITLREMSAKEITGEHKPLTDVEPGDGIVMMVAGAAADEDAALQLSETKKAVIEKENALKREVKGLQSQKLGGTVCTNLGMLAIQRMASMISSRINDVQLGNTVVTAGALINGDESLPPAGGRSIRTARRTSSC